MYKLTIIAGLLKRVRRKPELAAWAIAALLFLSALAAPARAQQQTWGSGNVVNHQFNIGFVPGQRVSVTVPNTYFLDGRVRFVKHSIKVYETRDHAITHRESNLTYSGESGSLGEHEFGHIFTIGRSDLPVPGEPNTSRVQVRIEVESFLPSTTQEQTEERRAVMLGPTFELIDDLSGKTVAFGHLLPVIMPAGAQTQFKGTSTTNADGGLQLEISKSLRQSLYGETSSADAPQATPTQVGDYIFLTGNTVELQPSMIEGQSLNLVVDAWDNSPTRSSSEGSDMIVTGASAVAHVKVFSASTGALLQSHELTSTTAGVYSIKINRDDLREEGEPNTRRLQLWIVVTMKSGSDSTQGTEESGAWGLRSTFEIIDNLTGRTTVTGGIWRTTNFLTMGGQTR